jgi:hypothetical protein
LAWDDDVLTEVLSPNDHGDEDFYTTSYAPVALTAALVEALQMATMKARRSPLGS